MEGILKGYKGGYTGCELPCGKVVGHKELSEMPRQHAIILGDQYIY
jgi:hypothetical protein